MRKKTRYMAAALAIAMMMTGCGAASKVEHVTKDASQAQGQGAGDGAVADEVAKPEDSASAATLEDVKAEDHKELLESFLKGEAPVYFDKENASYYAEDGYAKMFEEGKGYTLSEFINQFNTCNSVDGMNPDTISEVDYAYVDCGDDGVTELAVLFQYGVAADTSDLWVIKELDGKLQCIYTVEYGYRAYATINELGVVHYGGSSSASTHVDDTIMFDQDGNKIMVCGYTENLSSWGFYLPDEFVNEDGDMEGIREDALNIAIFEYSFDFAPAVDLEYGTDEYNKAWDAYYKNKIYAAAKTDDDYNLVKDDETIFDEGSPYKAYMDMYKVDFVRMEEAEQKVQEHKDAIGYTSAMDEAADVTWQKVDIVF